VRLKLQDLAEKREALRRAIKTRSGGCAFNPGRAIALRRREDKSRVELKTIEAELKKLEEERAAELY